MTNRPLIRLRDDPHVTESLRADLRRETTMSGPYDVDRGLVMLRKVLRGGAAPTALAATADSLGKATARAARGSGVAGMGFGMTGKLPLVLAFAAVVSAGVGWRVWVRPGPGPMAPSPVAPPPAVLPAEVPPVALAETATPATVVRPPPRRPRHSVRSVPVAVTEPLEDDALRAELGYLAQIRAARADPARVLGLVIEWRRRWPGSTLAEERDAAEVLAQAALGRDAEARAGAAVFLRRYPHSPFSPALRPVRDHP